MLVTDFNTSVRYTLQDESKNRWTDAELLNYINEGLRDIAVKTYYNKVEEDIDVVTTTNTYTLTKTPIKLFSVDTYQKYTQPTDQTLYFADPRAETVTVIYYAFPDTVTTEILEDIDLIDALKYFVLSKAYEKEDVPESFQKAAYFISKYSSYISENMTRWHGEENITLARSDYFI